MKRVKLLNIWLDNLSKTELLEQLDYEIVFTPNVAHIMTLQNDPNFFKAYSIADFKICDS